MEATDKELDQHYGRDATDEELAEARLNATEGYDEDDLIDACAENSAGILEALRMNNLATVGVILWRARKNSINRRTEFLVTGRIAA